MTPSTLNGTSAVSSSSKTCTRTSCASPCSSGISSLPTASARHFFSWISSFRNTDAYSLCLRVFRLPGSHGGSRGNHKEGSGRQRTADSASAAPRGPHWRGQSSPRPAALWADAVLLTSYLPNETTSFFFSLIKKPISPLGEQTDRTRERVRSRLRGTGEKRLNSLVQRLAAGQKVDPNQVLTQHDREVENLTWLSI